MRRVTVLAVLVVGLLLTACSSQEPAVVTEEQVPTPVAAAAEAQAGGASPGAGGTGPVAATVEFIATEFTFNGLPGSTSAGTVEFVMSNEGAVQHNMHIEELGDREIIPTISSGAQASGTAPLESGSTVTLYCSVPGHRAQGMEAQLQVQ